jgi:uncharacterized membrane protein YdjX (TVP38/TMEM64 family)
LHRDPEEDVRAARPLLTIIAVGTLIFGAIIAGMGILLVYRGSTGAATIRFFASRSTQPTLVSGQFSWGP